MINFIKYSSTGNDFIAIDNRSEILNKYNPELFRRLCLRRTGIGADGVLMVEKSQKTDFRMIYINADGYEAEMCANGARAISYFAFHHLKLKTQNTFRFETMNSIYSSTVSPDEVELKMTELSDFDSINIDDLHPAISGLYMNTGVPHCVFEVNELDNLAVAEFGEKIRYEKRFKNGTNVNFVKQIDQNTIAVRTYERGVEAETLSCGTGVTASALAMSKFHEYTDKIKVQTAGGELTVSFDKSFDNIYLKGKVNEIYHGSFIN